MSVPPRTAGAGRILEDASGPPRFQSAVLARLPNVRHGFFGREGGVSKGIYASLNAGPGSRDDPADVAENRRRIAEALHVGTDHLISLHQVHSARAVRVSAPWTRERPQADALVTTQPGLALTALSADCATILFADAAAGVIAAAHAGWKGALAGVLEATVEAMVAAGAAKARIVCAIGPAIRQASYEVGPEFVERFLAADSSNAAFFREGGAGKSRFDLPGYCARRLTWLELDRIDTLAFDTYSDETAFFSHRRSVHHNEADYGRNCAAICLAE